MNKIAIVLFSLLLLATGPAHALDRYISPTGSDGQDGTSWTQAWRTISHAFDQVSDAHGTAADPVVLHIAGGTYSPAEGEDYPITISRNTGYVILQGAGSDITLIDGTTDQHHNVYVFLQTNQSNSLPGLELNDVHITGFEGAVRAFNFDATFAARNVVVDGVIEVAGNRAEPAFMIKNGDADILLDNVSITGASTQQDGAGLYVPSFGGNITVRNSTFTNTAARDDGGAIAVKGGFNLTVQNVTIDGATAERGSGGGIYIANLGGTVTMDSVTVTNCSALNFGGGIYMIGIYADTLSLSHLELCGNEAITQSGGGLWCGGPILGFAQLQMSHISAYNNQAGRNGGGMSLGYNGVTLTDATLYQNTAGDQESDDAHGGGINFFKPTLNVLNLNMHNVVFWANEVYGKGGGFYVDNFSFSAGVVSTCSTW